MTAAGLSVDLAVTRGAFDLEVRVDVAPGTILAVLGPNGAGKSTLLRAVAGLLPADRGRIRVGDAVWDDADAGVFVPAADRRAGVVFQDYRLFPHLSVLDNVAYSRKVRGLPRRRARELAAPELARVGLADLADRRPAQLSGGQAQRVALARALGSDPAVLLLDEPLAALDARTRLDVRSGLRGWLAGFAGPAVLVTHDPLEAMVLADRILVLEDGRAVQEGTPADVARRPATEYVARLVGLNLYAGVVTDRASGRVALDGGGTLVAAGPPDVGARTLLAVPPGAVSLYRAEPGPGSARNVWPGTVSGLELLTDRVRVTVAGRPGAIVDVTPAAVADLALRPGDPVWLSVKATEVTAYPADAPGRGTHGHAQAR